MRSRALSPDEAVESLDTIRTVLARTTRYTHISWVGIALAGTIGLATSAGAWLFDVSPREAPREFLLLWCTALVGALGGGLWTTVRKARRAREAVFGRKLQVVSLGVLPSLVAAALVTCVLVQSGALDLAPGFWALFYGLGILAVSHVLDWEFQVTAWAFLVASAASFFLLRGAPHLAMMVTFGAIHLVLGVFRCKKEGACQPG